MNNAMEVKDWTDGGREECKNRQQNECGGRRKKKERKAEKEKHRR